MLHERPSIARRIFNSPTLLHAVFSTVQLYCMPSFQLSNSVACRLPNGPTLLHTIFPTTLLHTVRIKAKTRPFTARVGGLLGATRHFPTAQLFVPETNCHSSQRL